MRVVLGSAQAEPQVSHMVRRCAEKRFMQDGAAKATKDSGGRDLLTHVGRLSGFSTEILQIRGVMAGENTWFDQGIKVAFRHEAARNPFALSRLLHSR